MEKQTAIKYLKRLGIAAALMLLVPALLVVLFDPFYHYHGPVFGMKAVLEERDYEVCGTLDHFEYDAVLLGDSLVENTNTAWLSDLFGVRTVKAIRAGGSNADVLWYLDRAYEGHELKKVFYCIDKAALCADTTVTFPEKDYYYLMDRNPLNDWKYLWNKDVLLKKIPLQLAYNTVLSYDEGEAYAWYRTKNFSAQAMTAFYTPAESFAEAQALPEELDKNIALLKERILAHPETEFILFYPPTSYLWWDRELREGTLSSDYEMFCRIVEAFDGLDNVKLYGFFAAEEYAQLDHYMDVVHFSLQVNYELFADMAEGRYAMDQQMVDAEWEKWQQRVKRFSSAEIAEYYPDAVLYQGGDR